MRICIVNNSQHSDHDVQRAIRAINAQLVDFAQHWHGLLGLCRLEGSRSREISLKELRGDGLIYLLNEPGDGYLGYHDADQYGVPYGVVYTDYWFEPWTVTLSHEVLELLLDPHVNRLAAGPHPVHGHTVFHWLESCDAVQSASYDIGGIELSDFVLPAYFTEAEEKGMRMSYLGADIKSFGIAPGGYVGFYDPELGDHDVVFAAEGLDDEATAKLKAKVEGKRRYGRASRHERVDVSDNTKES